MPVRRWSFKVELEGAHLFCETSWLRCSVGGLPVIGIHHCVYVSAVCIALRMACSRGIPVRQWAKDIGGGLVLSFLILFQDALSFRHARVSKLQ